MIAFFFFGRHKPFFTTFINSLNSSKPHPFPITMSLVMTTRATTTVARATSGKVRQLRMGIEGEGSPERRRGGGI